MKTPTPHSHLGLQFGGYNGIARLGMGYIYPDYAPGSGIFYCPDSNLTLEQRNNAAPPVDTTLLKS